MKNEKPMTNEEKYQRWNEIREASEKRRLRKLKRKWMLKLVIKIIIVAIFAIPIALLCILSGSITNGIIEGFHQLGEDHKRFRRNKHFY